YNHGEIFNSSRPEYAPQVHVRNGFCNQRIKYRNTHYDGEFRQLVVSPEYEYKGRCISPGLESLCNIHASGYCCGEMINDRDVSFVIGDFEAVDLLESLDCALRHMTKEEESQVRICEPMTFSPHDSVK
uniref:Peptidylprolyl isomerase n=1 Tax=Echinococcus canadensis TaxID=519352 RepID=A0A915EY30_9CEST